MSHLFDNVLDETTTFFNKELSTNFQTTSSEITPELKFILKKEKWSGNVSISQFHKKMNYTDIIRPALSLERDFRGLLTNANFTRKINSNTRLQASYALATSTPGLSQIQPFLNTIDPLDVVVGNPGLKMQQQHQFSLNMNSYNFDKKRNMVAFINLNVRRNQVIMKSTIDENLIRTSTFLNVNGAYSIAGNINYNKKIVFDSIYNLHLDLNVAPLINRTINFNNEQRIENDFLSLSPKLRSSLIVGKNKIELGYHGFFTAAYYGGGQQVNKNLLRHKLFLSTDIELFKSFSWFNEIRFVNLVGEREIGEKPNVLWYSALTYKFVNQNAKISLAAYDVLESNNAITQTITSEYIENSEQSVLERYFLISLSWKINSTNN